MVDQERVYPKPAAFTTAGLCALVLVSSCSPEATTTTRSQQVITAQHLLSTLAIKGRAPKTGYTRSQFGDGWETINGCSTRNRILRRDLSKLVFASNGCMVLSGVLHDPYTAETIRFTYGRKTSSAVQIDHVVALGDAWQKGAQQLSPSKRKALANDPLNLLVVKGTANEAKHDADAATWLPPNKDFRCDYVERQISVKAKYGLWMTRAEHDATARILAAC